eukprot:scaffold1.g5460.t1
MDLASEPEEGEVAPTEQDLVNMVQPDASGEKLLAPRRADTDAAGLAVTAGRAPYFASPTADGWRGRAGKKKKKGKKKAAAAGFVDIYGEGAAAAIELHPEEGPIKLADVQNLVLWVLGEGANPRWCFVKNKPLVRRVVLLAAHGLDRALWDARGAALLPAWRRHLGHPIDLQARNAVLAHGQTVHALLTVPPRAKKRRREEGGGPGAAVAAAGNGGRGAAAPAPDLHGAAHGAASGGAAGGANGHAANGAATTEAEEAAAAPQAKRLKVSAGDDVSSRLQPSLATPAPASPAAAEPGAPGPRAAGAGVPARRQAEGPLPPSHYVLTLEQMRQHGYPLPQLDEATGELVCPEGYVTTASRGRQRGAGGDASSAQQEQQQPREQQEQAGEADGEQQQEGVEEPELEGFELTRATLVDVDGRVLLDELVVPHNPITDHNTHYRRAFPTAVHPVELRAAPRGAAHAHRVGITAEMLAGVTTRLDDVQAAFCRLVRAETLLVAHSGENDLKALKARGEGVVCICHSNVLDTSVLFPHPRGGTYKSALRVLASRFLARTIQCGAHDPVEDARAAMDLALLKIARGPAYGTSTGERGGERLVEVLGEAGRRCCLVDRMETVSRHLAGACSAIPVASDAEAVAKLAREAARGAAEAGAPPATDGAAGDAAAAKEGGEGVAGGGAGEGVPGDAAAATPEAARSPGDAAGAGPASPPGPPGGASQSQFLFSQLMGLQDVYAARATALAAAAEPAPCASYSSPHWQGEVESALRGLDAHMEALWEGLPPGTLLIVATGQGDTPYSRHVQEQRYRRQQRLDGQPPWSPAAEADLAALQARAQRALCFAAVKR